MASCNGQETKWNLKWLAILLLSITAGKLILQIISLNHLFQSQISWPYCIRRTNLRVTYYCSVFIDDDRSRGDLLKSVIFYTNIPQNMETLYLWFEAFCYSVLKTAINGSSQPPCITSPTYFIKSDTEKRDITDFMIETMTMAKINPLFIFSVLKIFYIYKIKQSI